MALRKLGGVVELLRPHNLLVSAFTTLIGVVSVSGRLDPYAAVPIAVVVLVAAGGYVINDYFDYEVDRVNKPYRPIPSGRVSRDEALVLALGLFAGGVALAILPGPVSFAYAFLNAVLMFMYSYKIKEFGLLGNITVAFSGASTIIYGGLAVAEHAAAIETVVRAAVPSLYAFLLLLGREIVKTIEDVEADAARGVKSLPRILGITAAARVASGILLGVVALSLLPVLMGYGMVYAVLAGATDVLIIVSVKEVLLGRDKIAASSKARSLLKLALLTGALAFLLDPLIHLA